MHDVEQGFGALRIQVGGGFVGEDERGARGEGPGYGDALLLSARKLCGALQFLAREPYGGQKLEGPVAAVAHSDALELHDKGHVFPRVEHGHQVVGLEHKTDAAQAKLNGFAVVQGGDFGAVDPNLPGGDAVEAANGVE